MGRRQNKPDGEESQLENPDNVSRARQARIHSWGAGWHGAARGAPALDPGDVRSGVLLALQREEVEFHKVRVLLQVLGTWAVLKPWQEEL